MTHRTSRLPHLLLRAVREIADGVRLLWGAPAHVAVREYMPRAEHQRFVVWLGWLERTTRALVVYLALRLIPHLKLRDAEPRPSHPRIPELWLCSPTYPAGWRAPFAIPMPRQSRRAPARSAPRHEPSCLVATQRFAIRYEAACRVLTDPRRRARAHALRLLKLARANARSNQPENLFARIVTPLLPLDRRNQLHHARIASSAAKQAFNAIIPRVVDALEFGALNPRPG